jgi:hypothetical protein
MKIPLANKPAKEVWKKESNASLEGYLVACPNAVC